MLGCSGLIEAIIIIMTWEHLLTIERSGAPGCTLTRPALFEVSSRGGYSGDFAGSGKGKQDEAKPRSACLFGLTDLTTNHLVACSEKNDITVNGNYK